MSVKTMSRVWDLSKHEGTDLLALLALADWSDADGICWYSNGRIAQRIRRGERTVTRILDKLRDSGELYAPPAFGAGKRTLKFITLGLEATEVEEVLKRRFGLTPIESKAETAVIFRRIKPDTHDGNKPVIGDHKPDTHDGNKPVIGDTKNPTSVAKNPSSVTKKPDIAMSTDPSRIINQSSVDPSNQPSAIRDDDDELIQILDEAGIFSPTRERLLSLPHIAADYVRAHLADENASMGLVIHRMLTGQPVPETAVDESRSDGLIEQLIAEGVITR